MPLSKKTIQKTLAESAFSPRDDVGFKTAMEAGTSYCETRAIELIRECRQFSTLEEKSQKLKMAISLLGASRAAYNEQIQSDQKGRPGSEDSGSRDQDADP